MKNSQIYLMQTDTTVGICSYNFGILNGVKGRKDNQPCLLTVSSFASLKKEIRVPKEFKMRVRRADKSTFIFPKNAYRVVNEECNYKETLKRIGNLYSTSANLTGERFDESWARTNSDIMVENSAGYKEDTPSKIYKLGKRKLKRIR